MGLPSPQFSTSLSSDQINPELSFYPVYGVTPSDKYIPLSITENGYLNVNATFSGSITIGEIGIVDEMSFTYGLSLEQPIGGVYQDTNPTLSAGETGAVRLTEYRAFHINLRDSNGIEITPASQVTSLAILTDLNQFTFLGTRLLVDGSQVIQPISGTVSSLISSYTRSDTFTSTGNGITVPVTINPTKSYSIVVVGTGSIATTWDVRLEGSLDNINFSQILQHTNSTGDSVVLYSGSILSPSLYIRTRCVSLSLGSATNIVVTLLGI